MIVGGGVVLCASYEARAFGVRTAMGGGKAAGCARRPSSSPPRFSAYTEASGRCSRVFDGHAPLVEGLSIDEAFLDVRGLRRASRARRPRSPCGCDARSRERVGLPITVGVARTKFLAKVASGVAKPDGLLVVPPDARARVPAPAAGRAALGRRPGHRRQAARRGLTSVGGVAELGEDALVGDARPGVRTAPARARPQPGPASRRRADGGGARSARSARSAARRDRADAVDAVARRPGRPRGATDAGGRTRRPHGRPAAPLRRLLARDALAHAAAPTAHTRTILAAARGLLAAAEPLIERRGLTLLGVAVANLVDDGAVQLALPLDAPAARRPRRRARRGPRPLRLRGRHARRAARPAAAGRVRPLRR